MQKGHAESFRKAIAAGSLPDLLLHPLRSIEVVYPPVKSDILTLNFVISFQMAATLVVSNV
jgi:hypothetical protein